MSHTADEHKPKGANSSLALAQSGCQSRRRCVSPLGTVADIHDGASAERSRRHQSFPGPWTLFQRGRELRFPTALPVSKIKSATRASLS
jgi:hypothetical protein